MREAPWARAAFWMYTAMFDEHRFGMSARALLRELESRGIQTRPLWQPIHCSPAHAGSLSLGGRVAEECYASALNLPCSAGLSVEQQVGVIRAIREIQQPASRRVV
jgi:perosamine synthetase